MAIAHGMASVVVIPTVAAGRAAGTAGADRDAAIARMAKFGSPYEYVWGTTRVADYAVVARRHMHEYGTTEQQLAEIAVAQRYGATLNPLSVNGKRGEITIDDVMQSQPIADPLKLLDCCVVNQGAGCIVMTAAADAAPPAPAGATTRWHSSAGARVTATSIRARRRAWPSFEGGRLAADTAFGIAGVGRDEIDVAGISDHFTINAIVELEAAGFCARGEGGSFVEGQATRIGGRFPVNTDGGFLSSSHAGQLRLFTVIELVRQLRHEAGPRQVEGASLAYCPRSRWGLAGPVLRRAREGVTAWPSTTSSCPRSRHSTSRSGQPSSSTASTSNGATGVPSTASCRPRSARAARAEYTWTPIAGTGEVYTYTVVHRAPTPAYQADAPYVIAHVTMDEGPRMISTLVDRDPAKVVIGMPVGDRLRRRDAGAHPVPLPAPVGSLT